MREQDGCDIRHAHRHAGVAGSRPFNRIDREKTNGIRHLGVRDIRTTDYAGQSGSVHVVRLLRSISCRISGVRMSCIARSSFDPWITIELARDMKLFGIIDSR